MLRVTKAKVRVRRKAYPEDVEVTVGIDPDFTDSSGQKSILEAAAIAKYLKQHELTNPGGFEAEVLELTATETVEID